MAKEKYVGLRISEGRKFGLEQLAKEHDMSLSELLYKGAMLYGRIPPGFIDEVSKMAEEMELPVSTIIVHNFMKWIAAARAWQKVFDTVPPGFMRAFRWQDGKLIRGSDLSKILEHEYTELFEELKKNLVESHEKDRSCHMSKEQAAEFMAQL